MKSRRLGLIGLFYFYEVKMKKEFIRVNLQCFWNETRELSNRDFGRLSALLFEVADYGGIVPSSVLHKKVKFPDDPLSKYFGMDAFTNSYKLKYKFLELEN